MPEFKPAVAGETWRHIKGRVNVVITGVFDEYIVIRHEDYDATYQSTSLRLADFYDNYVRVSGDAIVVHYTYIQKGAWAATSATAREMNSAMTHVDIVAYLQNLHPTATIQRYTVEVVT